MFGIGMLELAVIAIVALVFVGPQKLPDLAKQLGKFFVQIKRATGDVRSTVDHFVREAEAEIIQEEREKIKKLLAGDLPDDIDLTAEHAVPLDHHHEGHDDDTTESDKEEEPKLADSNSSPKSE